VGYRNPGDIRRCLEALSRSQDAEFDVYICENGGEAAFLDLARAAPKTLSGGQVVHLLRDDANDGFAAGVNRCMRAAPAAEAWWILNPDTQPAPDALARMRRLLLDGGYGAVGCTLRDAAGKVESCGGMWRSWLARAVCLTAPGAGRVDYLSGASLLVGPALVTRVGHMREDYFLYGEEVEWCLRARQAGFAFGVAAEAEVVHTQGSTTGSVTDVRARGRLAVYLDERNKMLIVRDRTPLLLPVASVCAATLLLLRFGKRRAWRQLRYAVDGWAAGLRNERGKPSWTAQTSTAERVAETA
jgi:GT2 family glycosyltransferase